MMSKRHITYNEGHRNRFYAKKAALALKGESSIMVNVHIQRFKDGISKDIVIVGSIDHKKVTLSIVCHVKGNYSHKYPHLKSLIYN